MNYDGWVTVGTKLDTKQLEKDLKSAERKLTQYEKEAEKLTETKSKAEFDLKAYEEQKRLIMEATDQENQLAQTEAEVLSNLKQEESLLQELNNKYSKQLTNLDNVNKKIKENALNQQLVSNEISETNQKLKQVKGAEGVKDVFKNIGKETDKAIKKVGKWALSIFAVRSAYSFVRQSVSTLSQYNEQLATDIEYIRYALAMTLEPLIKRIVDWIFTLMQYVNYISMQWFGINLFANASADSMNKATQSAKQLKKEMAGFDEMNVIGSNDANKGNSLLPSTDLTQNQIEIPDWLKKITKELEGLAKFAVQHPELLIGILGGMKLTGFIASIIGVAGGTTGLLGIAAALLIINAISIKNLIDEFEEYDKVLKNVISNTDQGIKNSQRLKKQFQETTTANEEFTKQIAVFIDGTGDASRSSAELIGNLSWWGIRLAILNGNLKDYEEILKNNLQAEKEEIEAFEILYQKTDKTTEQTDRYIDLLTEYRDSLIDVNNELNSNKDAAYMMSDTIKANNDEITRINEKIGQLNNHLQNSATNFEDVGTEASDAKKRLSEAKGIYDSFKSKDVKLTVNAETSKAQSAFKNIFNGISGTVSNIFSSLGLNIKIPKLATGGIINMPGRGVPIGGAIGGEAGAEGVIPLTDSQAMETLGQAIGRYITVNANITNTMNGRVISRELKKISANDDFAINR